MYFNPAGLAWQKGSELYLGTTIIMPSSSFFGPLQNNVNTETKMVDQTFTPINLYATYRLSDDLIASLIKNNGTSPK